MIVDAFARFTPHLFLMNINKENIKGGVVVAIAWAIALCLVFLVIEKFRVTLIK